MRHKVAGRKFSRNTKQRKALFFSGLKTLIEKGALTTTEARAKTIRQLAERLVTKAKKGSRRIHSVLRKKYLVNKLVDEIAPVFRQRPGGYLRIIRLFPRQGDKTKMVRLEFVEYPKNEDKNKTNKKK
jgi:large subunit ribosomal protein L17